MSSISFELDFINTTPQTVQAIVDFNNPFTKCRASRKFKATVDKDKLKDFKHLLRPYIQFLIDHDMLNENMLSLGADKFLCYIILKYPSSYPNSKHGIMETEGRYFLKKNYNMYCKNGNSKDILENESNKELISKYPARLLAPGETGVTTLILGGSHTGKTYLLTDEINRLKNYEYDLIILFTESIHVPSLDIIRDRPDLVILEGFNSKIPEFLKNLNSKLGLRFRFLLILDDIISEKSTRHSILGKMITTYRNSNISTCVLLQDPTFIERQTRGNFHQLVVTGFRTQETNAGLTSRFDIGYWAKERMRQEGNKQNINKEEVNNYLQKLLMKNGDVIYVNLKKSLEPVLVNLN